MSHPKLRDHVVDEDVLLGLAEADTFVANHTYIAANNLRAAIYIFLESVPDSWTVEELVRKMEGRSV